MIDILCEMVVPLIIFIGLGILFHKRVVEG